jgi:hypothetical protein
MSAKERKRLQRLRKQQVAQPVSAAVLPPSIPIEDMGAGDAEIISGKEMPAKLVKKKGNLAIFKSKAKLI